MIDTKQRHLCSSLAPAAIWIGLLINPVVAETIRGTVPGNWPAKTAAPVAIPLSDASPDGPLTATITIEALEQVVQTVAQIEPADTIAGTPRRAWMMLSLPEQARKQRIEIRVAPAANPPSASYTTTYADPELFIDTPAGDRVLGYWHGKPESGKHYELTDFIHPVVGLEGESLTSSRAEDHLHHRGVFWPWVRYQRNGKSIGSWWIPEEMSMTSGEIVHDAGPVFARFAAEHTLRTHVSGEAEPVIAHYTVCRVFQTSDQGRAVDVEIMQKALQPGISIGGQTALKKGYGGMTVRFAQADGVMMLADDAPLRKLDRNEVEAAWTDYSGYFIGQDGKRLEQRTGAAVFVHGSHPEWPTYWITRRYGPMGLCYPGLDMIELPTDDYLRLRYRIWIHRDDGKEARVNTHFNAYVADWKWRRGDDVN